MVVGDESRGGGDIGRQGEGVRATSVELFEQETTVRGVGEDTHVSVEVSLGVKVLLEREIR